ncbi:MAG TPA: winged helix-turn-helix domain-containing protein [Propionibacteriaceae bacterium]|nr:winged helix-turn-helix domain-containing protein [Propionibacteriaceae bacterium]
MTWQAAHVGASLGAIRWPYRVIAVESPSRILTPCGQDRLLATGIDLRPYPDGPSALLNLMAEDPGAVLAPTDLIGVNFLRFIRTIISRSDIPVLIGLTGDEESHQHAFHGLEAGARGLISLPADPDQLASAIRHLGLTRTESAASLQYGPIFLDPQAHQVRVSGRVVRVSPREFGLVEYLLAEAPRVVSVSEIAAVIGYDEQVDGLVRARKYVEKLRRKLDEARSGQPAVLETVRGLGYRVIDS